MNQFRREIAPGARFGRRGVPRPLRPAGDATRGRLIAKVHVAKKELRMVDDDYVEVLLRVAGVASAKDATNEQLIAVLKEFERLGFAAKSQNKGPRPADHPAARKARALWISLSYLGAVENPAEQALEAFARRQLKVEKLQWANQALCYRLIEALKAIAERHGWSQDLSGVSAGAQLIVLKRRLLDAILAKMVAVGLITSDWSVFRAAYTFAGIELEGRLDSVEQLDLVARALGERLRAPIRPVSTGEVLG